MERPGETWITRASCGGGLATVAVGFGLLWAGYLAPMQDRAAAEGWPIAAGRIVGPADGPHLDYEYRYGEATFAGRDRVPVRWTTPPRAGRVDVRFDLADPSRSLLGVDPPPETQTVGIMALFLAGFGLWSTLPGRP